MGASVGGRSRSGRGGFRDINVTPLVDVMLVLLVVFMVTAPLLTTGLRIDLPDVKAANTPVKDARLLVTVTKEERVLFGETDITDRIDQALKENQRVQTERELYIRADKAARYGIVATVVAAARASGVEALNLLVEPVVEELPPEPATAPSKTSKSKKATRVPSRSDAVPTP